MRNIVGSPVGGADFFGREEDLEKLRRAVEDGNHVLISAPRRVGKSSLLGELCSALKCGGWTVASADVQHARDELQFVEELINSLQKAGLSIPWFHFLETWVRRIRSLVKGSRAEVGSMQIEVGGGDPSDWTGIAQRIRDRLRVAANDPQQILVAVDELPIFLAALHKSENGPARVTEVLHWLRAARQAGSPAVRWVVCGSIGLDSFVESRGLAGTVNDFLTRSLGAFREPVATAFLRQLANQPRYQMDLSDDVCRRVLDRIGWPLPYYLQLMFQALLDGRPAATPRPPLTPADVERAFESLLDPGHTAKFSHWDTRLDDQFADADDARTARFVLKRTCIGAQGVHRETLVEDLAARKPGADVDELDRRLRSVLQLLERDGYVLRQDDAYAFRSFLLREYWRKRFA